MQANETLKELIETEAKLPLQNSIRFLRVFLFRFQR